MNNEDNNEQKTNPNNNDTDKTDQKLEEEIQRANEEFQKRKQRVKTLLFVCVMADLFLAALLAFPPTYSNDKSYFSLEQLLNRLWKWDTDTLDCAVSIWVRLIYLYGITMTAIQWGHPDFYDTTREGNSKLPTTWLQCQVKDLQGILLKAFFKVWSMLAPISSENERKSSRRVDGEWKLTVDVDKIFSKFERYDPHDIAEFWQSTLWLVMFLCITLFQAGIGFKIVLFRIDSTYFMCVFTAAIVVCHLEVYICKLYIENATEPENKFVDSDIHSHPLYLRHASERERERVVYVVASHIHSIVCNRFVQSAGKKSKARIAAENQLRNDSGLSSKQDVDVTNVEYFWRLFQLHRPYLWSFVIGITCMLLNSLMDLSMPANKGKLLDVALEQDWVAFIFNIKVYIVLTILHGIVESIQHLIMNQMKEKVFVHVQQLLYRFLNSFVFSYFFVCLLAFECVIGSRIMAQDTVFFDGSTAANLSERLEWGLRDMLAPFQNILSSLIRSSIGLVGAVIICWNLSWRLTLLAFSTLGPMTYLSMLFSRFHNSTMRVVWKLNHELSQLSREGFDNIRTVRSFSKEPRMIEQFEAIRGQIFQKQMSSDVVNAINQTLNSWCNLFSSVLITFVVF
ncbi:ATP-binding cassette transporter, subfamily B, member 4, group TAP protein PpABCB4, partial [Reticulomyxa filosa]